MATLFLDFNRKYVNGTNAAIYELLNLHNDKLYIFGPGHVPSSILNKGLKEYIKGKNISLVVTTEFIFFSNLSKPFDRQSIKDNSKSFVHRFELSYYNKKIFEDCEKFFKNFNGQKLLFMLQTDYYNFRSEYAYELLNYKDVKIVGFSNDLVSSANELAFLKNESFEGFVNENWLDFCTNNSHRIISTPHFLANNEFVFTDFNLKREAISIPGVNYWFRKEVEKVVKNNKNSLGIRCSKPKFSNYFRTLSRLGVNVLGNEYFSSIYQNNFLIDIRNSKYAFTCGSGLRWPLRKFFEIPAQGTILICYPFKNAEQYGFKSWENCVFIERPEEIIDTLLKLSKDSNLSEEIAFRGFTLVKEKHCAKEKGYLLET